jgi:hypothetical protein
MRVVNYDLRRSLLNIGLVVFMFVPSCIVVRTQGKLASPATENSVTLKSWKVGVGKISERNLIISLGAKTRE